MKKINLITLALLFCGIGGITAQYTDILNFNVINGAYPSGALIVAGNKLYGMTSEGGANDDGCIFSLDTNGAGYKDLLDFNGTNGKYPIGSLTLSGKRLYGLTSYGGANDSGCVFIIDTNGSNYKDLLDFNGTNGKWPDGSLMRSNNTLYGMTSAGGANYYGCIFSVDTGGNNYKDMFNFNGTTGAYPSGDLTISGKTLFGMTEVGGALTDGNVFSIDTNGSNFKDLFDFNGVTGQYPYGSLTLSTSGSILYGMSNGGGNINAQGVVFSMDTAGNNFKDLLIFNGTNGEYPTLSELKFSNHLLYGMTNMGGTDNNGVIFSIDTAGNNYKDIWNFNGSTGAQPFGSLTLLGNTIYGMTEYGGTIDSGVVFKYIISNSSASINQITNNRVNAKLYPNPNNGQFTLQLGKSGRDSFIKIYNTLGNEVYSQPLNENTINEVNIGEQASGVYLYRIVNQDANMIYSGKFIIEK